MLTDADRKLLVEAMGREWRSPDDMLGDFDPNPTFQTDTELGPLILWAVGKAWWKEFFYYTSQVCDRMLLPYQHSAWLFQSTEHFAKLLAAYLRKGE